MSDTLIDMVIEVEPDADLSSRAEAWVQEAAHAALRLLPAAQLVYLAESAEDDGSGVDVQDAQVLYAHVDGRRARRVPPDHAAAYADGGSIHAATDHTPVVFIENGVAHVRSSTGGGTVVVARPPSGLALRAELESLAWPRPIAQALAYYVAARWREQEASRLTVPTTSDLPDVPSPPTPPGAPEIDYTDASAVAPASTSISDLPPAPVFVPPADREPTGSEVTVGSLTLPEAPSASVDLTQPTAPTYQGPGILALDFQDFETYFAEEDPEMGASALEALQTQVAGFRAETEEALGAFQAAVQQYRAELEAEAEGKGLDVQMHVADVRAYAAEVEATVRAFSEETTAQLEKYAREGSVKQAFQQLEVQAARSALEADLAAHRSEVERRLAQAQIAAQEARQTAEQATQVALQNRARQMQAAIETYAAELQRYQGEVQQYGAEVQAYSAEASARFRRDQVALAADEQARQAHLERAEAHRRTFEQLLAAYAEQES